MKTPRRLLTQGRPARHPGSGRQRLQPDMERRGAGRNLIGISGDSKRSIPVGAVGELSKSGHTEQRDWKPGNHGDIFWAAPARPSTKNKKTGTT